MVCKIYHKICDFAKNYEVFYGRIIINYLSNEPVEKAEIQTFSLVFVIIIRVSILILIFYRGNPFFARD